jgi:surface protein
MTSVILNYTLPTNGLVVGVYLGTSVGITIDWGDLTTPTTVPNGTSTQTHTYTSSGTYIITISGTSLQLLGNTSAVTGIQYLTSVNSFGSLGITSFKFIGASNLISVPSTLPSSVTSMAYMFQNATKFNQDISGWDVSYVTNMSYTFEGASLFNNGGVALTWTTGTGTSNVTTMQNMFVYAGSFNQNVSTWNTSNVTNMSQMFAFTSVFNNGGGNAPLTWNTGNVTTMFQMFLAPAFNQDVSSFNLSKIQNMTQMFSGATAFNNGGVALAWTTIGTAPNNVNMTSMFNGAPAFNQNISSWNMSRVTNMTSMFQGATRFNNGDVALTWTTIGTAPNTVNMTSMFQSAPAFNQNISTWITTNVINMGNMFNSATLFNQNISTWDFSNVTNMANMFDGATAFNQNISSWNTSKVTSMSGMFQGATRFNNGDVALTWTTIGTAPMSMASMFNGASAFNQDISTWNTSNVTSMFGMFSNTTVFNQNIGSWITTNVTNMSQMFLGASAFNQNISSWNVSNVTNMSQMFSGTSAFNNGGVALSWTTGTGTSNVTNMANMFNNAAVFNQNLNSLNLSNVTNVSFMFYVALAFNNGGGTAPLTWTTIGTAPNNVNMTYMFAGASAFNQNISSWNMSRVTNMQNMFEGPSTGPIAFNNGGVPLTWTTIGTSPNTVSMGYMFQNARAFNQDISTWNMSNVTFINNMFGSATAFNNGGVALSWTTIGTAPNNVGMSGMFGGASSFNQNISSWNMSRVTDTTSMFSGANVFNNGGQPLTWSTIGTSPSTVNMSNMFSGVSAFNQNIGGWGVTNVTNMTGMLNNSGLDITNFNNLLNGWAAQTVKPNVPLGATNMKYTSVGQPGYTTLTTAPKSWTITGASLVTYTPTQANSGYSFTLNFSYSGFTIVTGNVYKLTNNASPSVVLSTYTAVSGDTSLTFNNVVLYPGGINTLTVTNQTTSAIVYNDIQINVSIVCFKEDSKILCFKNNQEQYIPIQNLRKGDIVKTFLHGYVPISMIGKTEMYNKATNKRIKDQLYKCSSEQYSELFEDLVITGCHSILIDEFKDEKEMEETNEINGDIYVTDEKYRLPACVDERAAVYEKEGLFTIYHLALDHDDYYMNYGIYANGLLVETCSKRYLKELSKMELIE